MVNVALLYQIENINNILPGKYRHNLKMSVGQKWNLSVLYNEDSDKLFILNTTKFLELFAILV